MDIFDLYEGEYDNELKEKCRKKDIKTTLIPIQTDTRKVMNILKKYLDSTRSKISYDALILVLMDFAICQDKSRYIDEIINIRNNFLYEVEQNTKR